MTEERKRRLLTLLDGKSCYIQMGTYSEEFKIWTPTTMHCGDVILVSELGELQRDGFITCNEKLTGPDYITEKGRLYLHKVRLPWCLETVIIWALVLGLALLILLVRR